MLTESQRKFYTTVVETERKKLRACQDKLMDGQKLDGEAVLRIAERFHVIATNLLHLERSEVT